MIKDKVKRIIEKNASIRIEANYLAPDDLYRGKIVVITGGAGDIAQAAKRRFLQSGAKVVLIGRNEEKLKQYQSDDVKTVVWDITDLSLLKVKMDEVAGCFGKIDVWINNAGIIAENDLVGSFFEATEEDWEKQFNVNAKALYFITQRVCKYFISKHMRGHIVQVLSIDGIRNTWQIYGLSKRVSIGLTKGIAKIAAPYGVTINGVAPGGVATKMIADKMVNKDNLRKSSVPSQRLSSPEEIANTVWFLASDLALQQVGSIIVCDGGDIL